MTSDPAPMPGATVWGPPTSAPVSAEPPPTPRGAAHSGGRLVVLVVVSLVVVSLLVSLGYVWGSFSEPDPVDVPERTTSVAADVLPSVVSVSAVGPTDDQDGSGLVWSADGLIVTNEHVVTGSQEVSVRLPGGRTLPARVVGTDPATDLAVLKVETEDLTPVRLGQSEDVVVGEMVLAVGSPLGLPGTFTSGVVSAVDRSVQVPSGAVLLGAVQTDAAINPGNSGGPLINSRSEVIGVNSTIATVSDSGVYSGSIGLGFAVPVDTVRRVVEDIVDGGVSGASSLGVRLERVLDTDDLVPGEVALLVTDAPDSSPILRGDLLLVLDGSPLTSATSLLGVLDGLDPGTEVLLEVHRAGQSQTLDVTLSSVTARTTP